MQTLSKEERLHEKKIIKELFEKGHIFHLSHFKIVWMYHEYESNYPVKILISVSIHNFKKATDRNYIKRMIREAYRTNKDALYTKLNNSSKKMILMINYSGKIIIPYWDIENKIILILQRLSKENEETAG